MNDKGAANDGSDGNAQGGLDRSSDPESGSKPEPGSKLEPSGPPAVVAGETQIGGRTVAYTSCGHGPMLVVLNGLAATAADWDPVFLSHLAAEHRLVLVDHRGMGASTDDGESFSIQDLAADVAAVVTAIGTTGVDVLGWSMGGFVAQSLAVNFPHLVSRLILLSTDGGGPEAVVAPDDRTRQIIDLEPEPLQQARALLDLLFPADFAGGVFRQFGEQVAFARSQLDPDLLVRQRRAIQDWHERGPSLNLVKDRASFIATGCQDAVIPAVNSRRLADQFDAAWCLEFPGGGHAFMAQYPEELASLINTFLRIRAH